MSSAPGLWFCLSDTPRLGWKLVISGSSMLVWLGHYWLVIGRIGQFAAQFYAQSGCLRSLVGFTLIALDTVSSAPHANAPHDVSMPSLEPIRLAEASHQIIARSDVYRLVIGHLVGASRFQLRHYLLHLIGYATPLSQNATPPPDSWVWPMTAYRLHTGFTTIEPNRLPRFSAWNAVGQQSSRLGQISLFGPTDARM